MREKVNVLLPCATFFSAGRMADGLVNLLMQATLVCWPLAAHRAAQFRARQNVSRILNEFASAYPLPMQCAKPGKHFRGAVFADQIVFGKQRSLRRAA